MVTVLPALRQVREDLGDTLDHASIGRLQNGSPIARIVRARCIYYVFVQRVQPAHLDGPPPLRQVLDLSPVSAAIGGVIHAVLARDSSGPTHMGTSECYASQ